MWKQKHDRNRGKKTSRNDASPSLPEKCVLNRPQNHNLKDECSPNDVKNSSREDAYRREQISLSRGLNRITAVGAFISFLALVALFVSLYFNRLATIAAISQSQTAQQEFQSSQRAWLSLEVTQVGKLYLRGNLLYIDPTIFISRNSGHSVAENVSYHAYIVMANRENGRECEGAAKGAQKPDSDYPFGSVIFPEDRVQGEFPAYDFSVGGPDQEFRTSPTPGSITPRLVACIVYTTPTDKLPHYSRMLYWIFHKGTQNTNFSRDQESYDIELRADFNGSTAI